MDVKLARNFNPDPSRTLAVADPKHEDTSFKVIDRRPFTAEGILRQEVVDENRRESEVAAKIAATKEAANKEAAAK